MDPRLERSITLTRRHFLGRAGVSIGAVALADLLNQDLFAQAPDETAATATGGLAGLPHFAPKARRVIYLFQAGGPSQIDLYDYKPELVKRQGTELPESVRGGQRLTTMSAGQTAFPIAPSIFRSRNTGKSGAWLSDLLPHTAKVADDLCFIKSMHTEQINHDPALTFAQTGFQLAGRPSLGAWATYGLGSLNRDLPAFVVMISGNGTSISRPAMGHGISSEPVSGCQIAVGGRPGVVHLRPGGLRPPNNVRRSSRTW